MEKVTKTLLGNYKNIYTLNGYTLPSDKQNFFKYMPYDRLMTSIENKDFVFVSPRTWRDPFERIYFNTDCSKHGYTTENIYCLCVTEKSTTNEEAAWNTYTGQTKGVKISIDYKVLFQLLDNYAQEKDCNIYIGRVIYDFEKRLIETIYKNQYYKEIFCPSQMSTEHYLSLLLLKRKSFSYENEIRIFIVQNKKPCTSIDENLLHIPCDYANLRIISQVMLSPYEPINKNDANAQMIQDTNVTDSNNYIYKIKQKLSCRIVQCRLYEGIKNIKSV